MDVDDYKAGDLLFKANCYTLVSLLILRKYLIHMANWRPSGLHVVRTSCLCPRTALLSGLSNKESVLLFLEL